MEEIAISKNDALFLFKKLYFKENCSIGRTINFMYRQKYIPPEFFYESLINKLVNDKSVWLDIGCGGTLFPFDLSMSKEISNRAKLLFGIDPDDNIKKNEIVHKKEQTCLENFNTNQKFNLITSRMVAEHVEFPIKFVRKIASMTEKNGLIVIYTVNKFGWVTFLTNITPFKVHLFFQKLLWRVEGDNDTFPTYMRMNTKKSLDKIFINNGFEPASFKYLEDASIFYRFFKPIYWLEIKLQKLLTITCLHLFKNNLIAVYRKK
jgi:hypothetical protein